MALQGFDEEYYLSAKLAQLQEEDPDTWASYTTDELKDYLAAQGMTPEMHYQLYGYAEGLEPNAYFDRDEYVAYKAAEMVADGEYDTIAEAEAAFEAAWTGDMYEHYLAYGSAEGIDPSSSFDESAYLAAKLAQLQATDPADWTGATIDEVRAAITAAGMTVLTHYLTYAAAEGTDGSYIVPDSSVVGRDYYLTADQDLYTTGVTTSADDTFYADIVQVDGYQVNSLASGDVVYGGAGDDVLEAQVTEGYYIGGTNMPISPRVNDVEIIKLDAMEADADTAANSEVYVNAENIRGVDEIWSWESEANLTITNLTTVVADGDHDDARNTSEMTIGMGYSGSDDHSWGASDLHVYFDPDYLLTGEESESQGIYYLLDQDADMNDTDVDGDGTTDLLAAINANGLQFTVDGVAYSISFDETLLTDGTVYDHATFVAALQDALQELIDDGTLPDDTTLTVDTSMTTTTYLDDGSVSSAIPAIVLSTDTDTVIEATGFTWVTDLVGDYNVYGRISSAADTTEEPLSVQVALEKVGNDSEGGELVIGSMDKETQGINEFYVTVYGDDTRPSNLSRLDSTGGVLDAIYITSDNTGYSTDTYADLTIGNSNTDNTVYVGDTSGQNSPVNDHMSLIQSNGFMGNLTLGTSTATVDDLVSLNTTDMAGSTTFFGTYGGSYVEQYSIATGSGDDYIDITLDGDAVDALGEGLTIVTGAGNDTVVINSQATAAQTDVSQATMYALNNLTIATGAGDDTVYLFDNFNFSINAGGGSDFVYIDAGDDGAEGVWTVGDDTAAITANTFVDRVLYQAELTVTFAGIESTVTVDTDAAGNFIADQATINAAIAEAIADSPELSKLLTVTYGTGLQEITITSTVEGLNNLSIDLYQPEVVASGATTGQVNLSSSDETALLTGLIATVAGTDSADDVVTVMATIDGSLDANGTATDYTWDGTENDLQNLFLDADSGTDSTDGTAVSFARINMGAGSNDLLVLDSNDNSANVLVFDQTFGKVTVVNYFDDTTNDVTTVDHLLDFTYYLDNQTDDSANSNNLSAVDIDVTYNTNATAEANSVTVLSSAVFTTTDTFDDMTASDLLAALNGTTAYAGLTDATLDSEGLIANLVGTVQDYIVMVENTDNDGEYKVFYLTATNDADTDFTTATLLGTVDFGDSIDMPLWGNALDMADYVALMATADAAAGVVPTSYASLADATAADSAGTLAGSYSITDTLGTLVSQATEGVTPGDDLLFGATALMATTGAGTETITFTGLTSESDAAPSEATGISFSDGAASLSASEFTATFVTASLASTSGETITVDESADAAGVTVNGAGQAATLDLTGGTAGDTLTGGDADDTIDGGAGVDTIVGGAGDDTITGGDGADALTGGTGADIFTYNALTDGSDTIADFSTTEGDSLHFEATAFAWGADLTALNTGAAASASQLLTGASLAAITGGLGAALGTATAAGNHFGVFAYDTGGTLYYLAGIWNGGTATANVSVTQTVTVATLTGAPTLDAADIVLV